MPKVFNRSALLRGKLHIHTCIYISPQLVHVRLCNGVTASLPWKILRTYLESCANIVQLVVTAHPLAPSSSRPPSCWPVARHVRLRNPIKSTLTHDAVAAVLLHKHHLIIRNGADLIQFVYGSHSRLAADLTLDKNIFLLPFSRVLQLNSCMRVCGGIGSGVCLSLFMVSACYWRGRLCFGRGRDRGFVLYISLFLRVLGWWVCVCLYTRVHTHKLLGYLM